MRVTRPFSVLGRGIVQYLTQRNLTLGTRTSSPNVPTISYGNVSGDGELSAASCTLGRRCAQERLRFHRFDVCLSYLSCQKGPTLSDGGEESRSSHRSGARQSQMPLPRFHQLLGWDEAGGLPNQRSDPLHRPPWWLLTGSVTGRTCQRFLPSSMQGQASSKSRSRFFPIHTM